MSLRVAPPWLITDDEEHVEHQLGNLKTGKEAEVFVVERVAGDRSCLLVHKRYRPRKVTQKGELAALGFQRAATFVNDASYRDGRTFSNSRDRRAAHRKTGYGRKLLASSWTGHELEMLGRAYDAGVTVPYPVSELPDGLVMEYVGNAESAAPRLAQARLSRAELTDACAQVREHLVRLVACGIVHADFSAYNVLWQDGRAWVIDFPQAVDIATHLTAFDLLRRDVTNISDFFEHRRVDCDPDDLYAELVAAWQVG